jgi:hypothetical protein
MVPITQLYVSIDAATKESLKAVDRPLFKVRGSGGWVLHSCEREVGVGLLGKGLFRAVVF